MTTDLDSIISKIQNIDDLDISTQGEKSQTDSKWLFLQFQNKMFQKFTAETTIFHRW